MPSPDPFDAYRRAFGGRTPDLHDAFCLNVGYRQAGCTRCADACPVDAITLHQRRPRLEDSACVHCGACLPVCPTDVFTQPSAPEGTLVQTASRSEASSFVVVCPVHQQPAVSRAPAEQIMRHHRCLAALSVTDLLALTQDGARRVWLDDTPCDRCRISPAHGQMAARTEEANFLLAAFGYDPAILLLVEHAGPTGAEPRTLPLMDGTQPKISRRSLFAVRFAAAERTLGEQGAEAPPDPSVPPASAVLPKYTPASRIELLRRVERLSIRDMPDTLADAGPFASVKIEQDTCSGCGLCARVCPTGALDFGGDDETYSVAFQAAACIDCHICEIGCPEEAISLFRHSDAATWLQPAPVELAAGELAPCKGCGVATAAHRVEGTAALCYVCRPGPGLVRALGNNSGAT